MGDQTSYANILRYNQIGEFRNFVSKFLVQESARLTIEMFANEVRSEETGFVLSSSVALNRREYEVVTLEQIRAMKSR